MTIAETNESIKDILGYVKLVSVLTYMHLTISYTEDNFDDVYKIIYEPYLSLFAYNKNITPELTDYAFEEARSKHHNLFGKPKYNASINR